MTEAISAFGTLLKIGDGSGPPENFTNIAEVRDIAGPNLSLDVEDVTSHTSAGGWEEVVATILRSGQVTFDCNFVPADATHDPSTGLIADMVNRVLRTFQLVFPDTATTTWEFSAYVVGFNPAEPVAGSLSAAIALKISGQPTLA